MNLIFSRKSSDADRAKAHETFNVLVVKMGGCGGNCTGLTPDSTKLNETLHHISYCDPSASIDLSRNKSEGP